MYTIKTELDVTNNTTNTNVTINQRNINDERPLPTLAKKMNNQNMNDRTTGMKQSATTYDEYDDEIFEEYYSDDEENNFGRLTMKATQDELTDVIGLYKEKLISKDKKGQLEGS
jgi:hypothetical protein